MSAINLDWNTLIVRTLGPPGFGVFHGEIQSCRSSASH